MHAEKAIRGCMAVGEAAARGIEVYTRCATHMFCGGGRGGSARAAVKGLLWLRRAACCARCGVVAVAGNFVRRLHHGCAPRCVVWDALVVCHAHVSA